MVNLLININIGTRALLSKVIFWTPTICCGAMPAAEEDAAGLAVGFCFLVDPRFDESDLKSFNPRELAGAPAKAPPVKDLRTAPGTAVDGVFVVIAVNIPPRPGRWTGKIVRVPRGGRRHRNRRQNCMGNTGAIIKKLTNINPKVIAIFI